MVIFADFATENLLVSSEKGSRAALSNRKLDQW